MIDAHCHLQDLDNPDISDLKIVICNGADIESSQRAIKTAQKFPNVWATVGIHPESMSNVQYLMSNELRELVAKPKVVAIGECGLDFTETTTQDEKIKQIELLKLHINLAQESKLPLVIHNRNANKEILEVLDIRHSTLDIKVMIHCFTSDTEFMKECVKRGWYISFGGILTFKKSEYLREVAKQVPENLLLTETDSPYLSPEPYRKEINCPKNVKIVAELLANLRDTSINEIEEITEKNCRKLFNITP